LLSFLLSSYGSNESIEVLVNFVTNTIFPFNLETSPIQVYVKNHSLEVNRQKTSCSILNRKSSCGYVPHFLFSNLLIDCFKGLVLLLQFYVIIIMNFIIFILMLSLAFLWEIHVNVVEKAHLKFFNLFSNLSAKNKQEDINKTNRYFILKVW
jgi:hypothetical protein